MSMTSTQTSVHDVANYGGLIDAIGGAATVVLAIIALAGTSSDILLAIATIVFGAALLIQSGTVLSELSNSLSSGGVEDFSGGGLSMVFLAGIGGIVLGVLALIGIHAVLLTSIAVIAFGSGLVFGSNSVRSVFRMKQASFRVAGRRVASGGEVLATEIAAGSAGLQFIGGLTAIVLGILAVTGTLAAPLSLIALLVMGATLLLTGSTLTGVVQGFMRPASARSGWSESPAE